MTTTATARRAAGGARARVSTIGMEQTMRARTSATAGVGRAGTAGGVGASRMIAMAMTTDMGDTMAAPGATSTINDGGASMRHLQDIRRQLQVLGLHNTCRQCSQLLQAACHLAVSTRSLLLQPVALPRDTRHTRTFTANHRLPQIQPSLLRHLLRPPTAPHVCQMASTQLCHHLHQRLPTCKTPTLNHPRIPRALRRLRHLLRHSRLTLASIHATPAVHLPTYLPLRPGAIVQGANIQATGIPIMRAKSAATSATPAGNPKLAPNHVLVS